MNTQKGFASILIIILGLLVVGGGSYVYLNNDKEAIKIDDNQNMPPEVIKNDTSNNDNLKNTDTQSSSINPTYDFLYTVEEFKEGVYSANYVTEDGYIKTIGDVPGLYIYNIETDKSVSISIEEANKLIINQDKISLDRYSISYEEYNNEEKVDGFYISNEDDGNKRLNIQNTYGIGFAYSRSFRFFGWIEEGVRDSERIQSEDFVVHNSDQDNLIVCTQDVKQCQDRSYVGRTGSGCEFICPDINKEVLNLESVYPLVGRIGNVFELKGYSLLDGGGDQNIAIRNSLGEVGYLGFGNPMHINLDEKYVGMSFELTDWVCKKIVTDIGFCMDDGLRIIPGDYYVYVKHGRNSNLKSNEIKITVLDKINDTSNNKNLVSLVSNFRAGAELHYLDNSDSYSGVCNIDGNGRSVEILNDISGIVSRSNVVCVDTDNKWSLSVERVGGVGLYCSDSTGFVGEINFINNLSCN